MPDGREPTTVDVIGALSDVEAAEWDACVDAGNPFCRWGFLSALEESGSAVAEQGWLPRHLVIRGDAGTVVACAPLYLKGHSYGEFVFDWGWADAYERAGGRYFPKLLSAVPFTPVMGKRLLVRADVGAEATAEFCHALAQAMVQLAERMGVSSLHVNFPPEDQWQALGGHGFLQRIGQQFHWRNHAYADFDAFLADLRSAKRKSIRKERKSVAETGLDIKTLTGADITEAHWDAFYRFYRNTSDKKWGSSYLTRDFFSLLAERMGDNVVLVMAFESKSRGSRPVAGALNIAGNDTLYGRTWGCDADYKFLHFEACYYRAIDYAIERGLTWVEAGAQGPHKVQRGYLPRRTYSAHWIADAGLRRAVDHFVSDERRAIEAEIAYLDNHSPFRREDG